jgi:hypothetical protein
MKIPTFALASALVVLGLSKGVANDIYISQNGAGSQSGADAADAAPVAFLNISGNWGSGAGQVNPGETIHLLGAITNSINLCGSGLSLTNPTTLYFESNAMMTAPTLPVGGLWIQCSGMSNLVIDGGVDGIIQLTDNGTCSNYWDPASGNHGTCDYTNFNLQGINAMNMNNFTVRNLTISNLYNRLRGSDDPATGSWKARAFNLSGNNITIQNNVIFNTQDGIDFGYGAPATSNLLVISNYIMGFNHGIVCAAGNAGSGVVPLFYNAFIRSNRIDGMDYYESTNASVGGNYHRDPIFLFNLAVNTNFATSDPTNYYIGCISNVDISYNVIGPGVNPQTVSAGTAAIFNHNYSTNQQLATRIYNNVFALKPPLKWDDGFICAGYSCGNQNIIANNTIIWWHTNITGGGVYYPSGCPIEAGQNCLCVNNILLDGAIGILLGGQPTTNCFTGFGTSNQQYVAGWYSGYNIFSTGGKLTFDQGCESGFGTAKCSFQSYIVGLPQWKALGTNYDNTSSTSAPALNTSTWAPLASDTVARGKGMNLSAFFSNDVYGNPRSPIGPWDIGAVAYVADATPPAPPSDLRVVAP